MEMVLLIALFLGVYFIPVYVASAKQSKNFTSILLLNIFLGWTFIGWVAALIWATMAEASKKAESNEWSKEIKFTDIKPTDNP